MSDITNIPVTLRPCSVPTTLLSCTDTIMLSLLRHGLNICRYFTTLSVCLCPFQIFKQLPDFHKTWYQRYANVTLNFLQSVTIWRTCAHAVCKDSNTTDTTNSNNTDIYVKTANTIDTYVKTATVLTCKDNNNTNNYVKTATILTLM